MKPVADLVPRGDEGSKVVPPPKATSVTQAKLSETASARSHGNYAGRDPFWPVGYKPPVIEQKTDTLVLRKSEWEMAEETVQTRICGWGEKDGKRYTSVNGKVAREGDSVSLDYNKQTYTWWIKKIRIVKNKVVLDLEKQSVR